MALSENCQRKLADPIYKLAYLSSQFSIVKEANQHP